MEEQPVLGCALNLSDGRHTEFLERVSEVAGSAAHLLDLSSDPDHHRSVFTLCGSPEPLVDAVVRVARLAAAHIDLTTHRGLHPRTGAVDVVPFYPLRGAPMVAAVEAARRCAGRLWDELAIPSFYYEEAALAPESRALSWIRKYAFLSLAPDVGGPSPHPTAGASVIGARGLLVAYNVDLATTEIEVARRVAAAVRTRWAGRARALGLYLPSRGAAQVSMNILKPEQLTLSEAFETVSAEAEIHGAGVGSSEIVGLVPRACLGEDAAGLKLRQEPKILEDLVDRLFAA